MLKKIFINLTIVSFSFIFTLIICELILRAKHSIFYDYDIEQWKYAKLLKVKHSNPKIGHVHRVSSSAILQGVEIQTNKIGQRDKDYDNQYLNSYDRSFLFIGSSIALGWGVESENTFINKLNKLSSSKGKKWIYVNGGIGNYNTERYINNYFENWSKLQFTDIVVHFFVNDTEIINQDNSNFITRNFQTGVILWKYLNSLKSEYNIEKLSDYYKKKYDDNFEGFTNAKNELKRLSIYCKNKNINCHLILMPDIHQLEPYKLNFINLKMEKISKELNYNYYDLLSDLEVVKPSKKLWNNYNDPHPNVMAHDIISQSLDKFFTK